MFKVIICLSIALAAYTYALTVPSLPTESQLISDCTQYTNLSQSTCQSVISQGWNLCNNGTNITCLALYFESEIEQAVLDGDIRISYSDLVQACELFSNNTQTECQNIINAAVKECGTNYTCYDELLTQDFNELNQEYGI